MEFLHMKYLNVFTPLAVAAVVLVSSTAANAQHFWLPAQDSNGKIHSFTVTGGVYSQDREVHAEFSSNSGTDLKAGAYRAGAPSVFPLSNPSDADPNDDIWGSPGGVPNQPNLVGFSTMPANSAFILTNPVLDHTNGGGSGNLLYWDGNGDPNFGAVPTDTIVDIRKEDGGTWTHLGTLDGGGTPEVYLETITNATGGRAGHFHLRYDVVKDDGMNPTTEADNGIYLFGQVANISGLQSNDFVAALMLKNAAGTAQLDSAFMAAQAFVANNVVPEPASVALLVIGGGLLLVGRNRRASA